MYQGKIIKYSASAGSGKTHTITREYLSRLFVNPFAYRRILAVTFTNKAAAEMKERILKELSVIASGRKSEMLKEIEAMTGMPVVNARDKAEHILSSILTDYSRFSVGTIDSFFQRVFRAFTREIGVQSNFNIYLDYSLILQEAVEELINSLHEKGDLRRWLIRYAGALFEEGKPVNLESRIYDLSKSIYSEDYKLMPSETKEKLSDLPATEQLTNEMEKVAGDFTGRLKGLGRRAVEILDRHGVTDDQFAGKMSDGAGKYLRLIARGEIKVPFKRVVKALDSGKWYPSGVKSSPQIDTVMEEGVEDILHEIAGMFGEPYRDYLTAKLILSNIYVSVILSDVLKVIRERTAAENSFILADTGDLLMQITGSDQTPFIYEKSGNEYDVFMLDEFQDTSLIQYTNFRPLIENSLAQGSDTLVVGDVKQAIYRWRNGKWSILGKSLEEDFPGGSVETRVLERNWRSLPEIVRFNNRLFTVMPGMFDADFSAINSSFTFKDVYSDTVQKSREGSQGGYVRIEFLSDDDNGKSAELSVEKLPGMIMRCQDDGYTASDIGILVRTGKEGRMVLDYITNYINGEGREVAGNYNFRMVSGDSLLVGSSPSVRFIVSLLVRLTDSENSLNRAEMLRFYTMAKRDLEVDISYYKDSLEEEERRVYPAGYDSFIEQARSMPLSILTEKAIDLFELNGDQAEIASLNFFQDQVLEFMTRKGSSVSLFTEWWLTQGYSKGINISGDQDAISIMTVHKSKGLEFKVVIVPFISWDFDQKAGQLLWMNAVDTPFSNAGIFPASWSKAMENTCFEDEYHTERLASYLDNLNVLYVAFTRASERLYGFAFGRNKSHAGNILKRTMTYDTGELIPASDNGYTLMNYFNGEETLFEAGSPDRVETKPEEEEMIVSSFKVYDSSDRLRLRLYGRDMLKEDGMMPGSGRLYGTVLHEIFSKIITEDDIEGAVRHSVVEGLLESGMARETEAMIREMISHREVKKWFDGQGEVLTESDIVTGEGDIRRPDRVIIRDDKVSVIDFKFGEERGSDRKQVENYSRLLNSMGYDVTEAVIWYVTANKLVRV